MIALWIGLAWGAQGVVVQVVDEAGLVEGVPQVSLADEAGTEHTASTADDGQPPDAQAGDGTWSTVVDQVVGTEVVVAVTDGAGRRWTGPFRIASQRAALRVVPTATGGLRTWRKTATSGAGGIPPDPTWTDPRASQSSTRPWGLLVWAAGLGLAALGLFAWADPGLAGGPGGTLERVRLTGPQALGRFLDERARLGRLVLAGPSPIEVPQALLLGPGRLDVDDLLLALDRLAAPIQLVILGELEGRDGARREAALVQLAERLPEGVEAVVIELDRPQGGRGKVSQPS